MNITEVFQFAMKRLWLTADCLIAYKVLPTASHIGFNQKSTTLAYVPEVTVTHFPDAQTTTVNPLLSPDVYFIFFDFD